METNTSPALFRCRPLGVFTFSSPINTSTMSTADNERTTHCGLWMALFHKCEEGFLLQQGWAADNRRLLPLREPEILEVVLRGRGCPGVVLVVTPVKKWAFSSAAFSGMQHSANVFLCAPRSVKLHFPQESFKPAMLNVRAFPGCGFWGRHHHLKYVALSSLCIYISFPAFNIYLWLWHSNRSSVWK